MPGLPAAAAAGAKSLQSCPILCTGECTGVGPGLPNHHQRPEITQTHVQCGEGNDTPLQYSCWENPTDREAWWAVQSMESLRVAHNWATSLSFFTFKHWRRKWQPTPVFLPGDNQGRGSLVGCRLWGHTESDTSEAP